MDVKVISVNVGKALLVSALFMFLSMMVSIVNGMDAAFGPLAISFLITFIVGAFPFIFVRKVPSITMTDGYLIIFISWILSFIFGMLPYVLYGGEFSLINSLFESVSGFTTTGYSVVKDVEVLPKSLLFWRSSTHFIGGLGVIVFLLLVIPDSSPFRLKMTNLELSSLSREGYRYRSSRTVWIICLVYLSLAVVETILLWVSGMSLFDAVNHSFSTIATGGFSTRNASIAYFDSRIIEGIVIFFMVISGMHFGMIFHFATTGSFKVFKNPVVRFYLGTIAVMTLLVAFGLLFEGTTKSVGNVLWTSLFHVVSFITTTGFAVDNPYLWPMFPSVMLIYCGIQCGCSGSTSGGIKSDRVLIALKAAGCEIRRRLHPNSVYPVRLGNHLVSDNAVNSVLMYFVVYAILATFAIFALIATGLDGSDASSIAIATIGNVGISAIGTGVMGGLSVAAKLVCCFNMFLGRVEIYPVLIIFYLIFNRKAR